ncbi:hypothetical protein [Terrimonas alba]|uniref:hypothetical protein n=1 Tax=Terrimonas alba TaxID=3349636 RepID=UPI0035F3CDE7
MNKSGSLISQLFSIRNRYGKEFSSQKLNLLHALGREKVTSKKALQSYYDSLLYLLAYPDNRSIYQLANQSLQQLQLYIQSHETIKARLYNSGITNTRLCAAFSFEIVKWLRNKHPKDIRFHSFEADDGQIQSILAVVMPRVESEILLDTHGAWRSWLQQSLKEGEDMLDRLIAVFEETDIRPSVRDELWVAIGINVEIDFPSHHCLPGSLIVPYYHRSLIKKNFTQPRHDAKPIRVSLDEQEAEYIIECSRMILVRQLREIDPITFTSSRLVSYYRLARGLSIALMGMVAERRSPIDSYMGYVVFKNGLPLAYAGSWILFDSGRIGLNVFPAYRGGESQYIFEQVLKLHSEVYQLNRFSVDPYQVGKENSDAIQSGAFWIYYRAGFRPMGEEQKQLAEAEALKIKSIKGYRSPASVLKKLADSRLEILLKKNAVRFDATDLSLVYARILKDQYNNNRKLAEEHCFTKLVEWLQLKNHDEEKLQFILKNWCVLLFRNEPAYRTGRQELLRNSGLKKILKKLFALKAEGSEEDYIAELQQAGELRKFFERMLK